MINWNVYQSEKDYSGKESMVLGTWELIWWLLFANKKYVVTINRRKD